MRDIAADSFGLRFYHRQHYFAELELNEIVLETHQSFYQSYQGTAVLLNTIKITL